MVYRDILAKHVRRLFILFSSRLANSTDVLYSILAGEVSLGFYTQLLLLA